MSAFGLSPPPSSADLLYVWSRRGRDSLHLAAADTPDTAFYQWVPFTLVFQVGETAKVDAQGCVNAAGKLGQMR